MLIKRYFRFCYAGRGKWHESHGLENTLSQDWSVVGCSNFFGSHYRPFRPFLGCTPHRKVCAHKGIPTWKYSTKNNTDLGLKISRPPVGCQMSKLLKTFQSRSNYLRNRFIALPCTSNWLYGLKRENSEIHFLVHFPLGFSCKNFQNFPKNFFAQNYIKRHFRYLVFPPQNRGPVYAPIRHIGGLEKILLKFRIYP